MTSRERVLRAFKISEGLPDRVPVQFDLCKQLLEHFGTKLGIPVKYTNNLYEDVTYRISGNEIRLAMGSDVVVTGASVSDDYRIEPAADGTWINEYGMRMRQGPVYVELAEFPMAGVSTIEEVLEYPFPDVNAKGKYRDAEELIARYKNDYVVIGDIEVTIFSLAQQLIGMEKLMIDMAMEEDYVPALFEKCTDFQTKIGIELIKRGVDAIWIGDDFGSQTGLLFSPDMFREQLKPYYTKMIKAFKEVNPDIIPILHCDGAVKMLLDDIKEIGFDVFNPVQPGVPGHSPKELKEEYGGKFAFWGAIDQQDLLPNGTDEALEEDITEKIRYLGAGGGYMIAPAHIIQSDVSPGRVEKFVELCMKHGKY
ncbi:MAG: uroporphyrinogen decarboxylase family protein [Saccharofermentanales bacterium]